MKRQCIIVGLGRYGRGIAKRLSEANVEVLAVDRNMSTVEKISDYVTKAVCIDVTVEEAWKQLPIKDFDIGIVCFGENVSASILTCMILQESGVKRIIAKAGNKLHKDILEKLNIDEVVFPEEYVAEMTAQKIIDENF